MNKSGHIVFLKISIVIQRFVNIYYPAKKNFKTSTSFYPDLFRLKFKISQLNSVLILSSGRQ